MTQLIECQDLPKNKQNKQKIFQTCFRYVYLNGFLRKWRNLIIAIQKYYRYVFQMGFQENEGIQCRQLKTHNTHWTRQVSKWKKPFSMKIESDQFSRHLGSIMCYKFTLKIYPRPPKAARRSIKAVFKSINSQLAKNQPKRPNMHLPLKT